MLNANLSKFVSGLGKTVCDKSNGWTLAVRAGSSSSKLANSFKVVTKRADPLEELSSGSGRHLAAVNSNWELLDPNGYSFFLPGSIGLAWTEPNHIDVLSQFLGIDSFNLECSVQDCPILLRQGVIDIFPGAKLNNGSLTVMTLTHNLAKTNKNRKMSEQEWEKITKLFVMVAQDICMKLKMANYWADFINPFSGLPYLNAYYNPKVTDSDKQLASAGFSVRHANNCRVIAKSAKPSTSNVVGVIYTSSPTNSPVVQDVTASQMMSLRDFEIR
ncbi:cobalamin trafficking protein CblD-like isoform X2 [Nilaparvata lugens]|nr:cobalamin trafficking protein CblD-like isoform X2 [Nilaparvata lugens]XP_039291429.1 cobalamin trafficking protein CblD-like isoform X2 [Nilaparvata lugens]XP_039291430.1 cobalamin trafficking protein CblD-like isoform X2 [Nilaparvata lugens]